MYAKWIYVPEGNNLKVMRMYEAVGFPWDVGSTDMTHVRWERPPICEAVRFYMGEEGFATVTYQVTADLTLCVFGVMPYYL
ncbi:unnamed protein product, partial [Discosporangium mesarthrocarpum]